MKTFRKDRGHLTYKEIQMYLSNKLNTTQRFDVESHLLDCPLCSGAVEGFQKSKNIGEDTQALKKLTKEIMLKTNKKPVMMWPLRIAASLLLLLIPLASIYFLKPQNITEKYAENLHKEFAYGDRMGINESQFQTALKFCENEDYSSCINYLNRCLNETPDNAGLKFYLGLAEFGNKNFENAIINLNNIGKNSSYYDEASWYLILCHLENGDKSKTIGLLEEYTIQNPNGFYFEEAKELLKTSL